MVNVIINWSLRHSHHDLDLWFILIVHYLIMHVFSIETEDDYQGCQGKFTLGDNFLSKELVRSDRQSYKRKSRGYDHNLDSAGALKKPRLDVGNIDTPTVDDIPGERHKTKRDDDEVMAVRGVAGITRPVLGKSVEQNGQGSDLDLFTSPDENSSKKSKRKRCRTYSIPSLEEEEEEEEEGNVVSSGRGSTIVIGSDIIPPTRYVDACVEEGDVDPVCFPMELLSTYFNHPQHIVMFVQCVFPCNKCQPTSTCFNLI